MAVRVEVPVRIRVDPASLASRPADLEVALQAAAGRALRASRERVAGPRGGFASTSLEPPTFTWSGPGLRQLDRETRSGLESRIALALLRAAGSAGLLATAADERTGPGAPLAARPEEPFDPERYDPATATYRVPGYQDAGRGVQVRTAPGREGDVVRMLVAAANGDDPDQRSAAVGMLTSLIANAEARAALRDFVTNTDEAMRGRRLTALTALAAANQPAGWEIILAGVGHETDSVPEYAFLDSRLQARDRFDRVRAAHVTAFLIDEAGALPGARRLREMAQRHGLYTSGELGVISLARQAVGQYAVLRVMAEDIAAILALGPAEDPHQREDLRLLREFGVHEARFSLNATVFGVPIIDVLATQDTASIIAELERMTARLALAIDAAPRVRDRVEALQANATALRGVIGWKVETTDELRALFSLRHRFVVAFAGAPTNPAFRTDFAEAENDFARFDQAVAALKWVRIRTDFGRTKAVIAQVREIMPYYEAARDPFFRAGRDAIEERARHLEGRFSSALGTLASGQAVRFTDEQGRTISRGPLSLAEAVNVEIDVTLLTLEAAIVLLYGVAFRFDNVLAGTSVGSEDFRRGHRSTLWTLRRDLQGYYDRNDFQAFADNHECIGRELAAIGDAIHERARFDLFIQLAITVVAAIVSFGIAAIVRVALIGQVVAGVRTAQSVATIAFLIEAGVFTAAQVGGERLAFGRPITLERTATALATNLVMFGAFRLLGRAVAPLAQGSALRAFVLPHMANLGAMTGINALMTHIETGRWPQDLAAFFGETIASYVLLASVHAGVSRAVRPAAEARLLAADRALAAELAALQNQAAEIARAGTIDSVTFEAFRAGKLRINSRTREMVRLAEQFGIIDAKGREAVEQHLAADDARVRGAVFIDPATVVEYSNGLVVRRALPDIETVPGVERVGGSPVYRYDAVEPGALTRTLARYQAAGFAIERHPGGLIRVVTPARQTAFVLVAGPILPGLPATGALAALPAGPAPLGQLTFLGRITAGQSPADVVRIEADLRQINPRLLTTLETEFPGPEGLAAAELLIEQRAALPRLPIDAIRGLARMFVLSHATSRATIRRLLVGLDQTRLAQALGDYHHVSEGAVSAGSLSVALHPDFSPDASATLLRALSTLRAGNIELPGPWTQQAARGLLRVVRDNATTYATVLLRIRPASARMSYLETQSPIVDPTRLPPTGGRIEQVLRRHALDLQPGINFLAGTPADVANAVLAQTVPRGGTFAEPRVRTDFEGMVDRYRRRLAELQAGGDVERNVEGDRSELAAIVRVMWAGADVFSLGLRMQLVIDPALYELRPGIRVINAPQDTRVQLDVGARLLDGRFLLVEATSGELGLPMQLQVLDPQSGLPAANLDWTAIDPEASASHRKWLQVIKLFAASRFATDLGRAWGDVNAQLPAMRIVASRITAPAQRALRALGFEPVETAPGGP